MFREKIRTIGCTIFHHEYVCLVEGGCKDPILLTQPVE